MLYASNNKDALPPDLGTLVTNGEIAPATFVCPDTNNTPPPPDMPRDATVDWVNKNSDYVYLGANWNLKTLKNASTTVECYENDGNHHGDGINVLFVDGHVEFLQLEVAHKYINDSTGQK
jgi:prepilin-type processing-associated H-X9-DG protein